MYCIIISKYRVAQNRTKFVHVALASDYGYYSRSIEKRSRSMEKGAEETNRKRRKKRKIRGSVQDSRKMTTFFVFLFFFSMFSLVPSFRYYPLARNLMTFTYYDSSPITKDHLSRCTLVRNYRSRYKITMTNYNSLARSSRTQMNNYLFIVYFFLSFFLICRLKATSILALLFYLII